MQFELSYLIIRDYKSRIRDVQIANPNERREIGLYGQTLIMTCCHLISSGIIVEKSKSIENEIKKLINKK